MTRKTLTALCLLLAFAGAARGGNRADTFTRANSSTTPNSPSDGLGNYTIPRGVFGIRSNAGYLVSGSDCVATLTGASAMADVRLTVSGTLIGPTLNASDADNKYIVYYNSATVINFARVVAGSFNIVSLTGQPDITAGTHQLGIKRRVDGTTVDILLDGTIINTQTAQSFNNTVTNHGFWGFGAGAGLNGTALSITDLGGVTAGTLSVTGQTTTTISLAITARSGGTDPDTYQLQRSAHGANTYSNDGSALTGQTSSATFTSSGLTSNTTYDYRVIVTDAASSTSTSNVVSGTTAASAATQFGFTGPSSGASGTASANFTVTPNGSVTAAVATPSDGGAGGTFTPTSLTWSSSLTAQTFTYTPASGGTKTITVTITSGSPTTVVPTSLSYASILKSYVAFIGDSLTYGVDSSNADGTVAGYNYPGDVMRALGATWNGSNRGISGWSIVEYGAGGTNLTDDLPNWASSLYDSTRPLNLAVVMIGTNDLNHVTGAAAHATLVTYCGALKAIRPWKIAIVTIPSSTSNATKRGDYNTLIKANWASYADALVDITADTHIGVDAAASTAAYFPDGTHMTDAGYATLAAPVVGAVVALKPAASSRSRRPIGVSFPGREKRAPFVPSIEFPRDAAEPPVHRDKPVTPKKRAA